MDSRGLNVEIKEGQCRIKYDNTIIATESSRGSLYVLDTPEKHESTEVACIASLQLWHERLAHVRNLKHDTSWGGQGY